MGKGAVRGTEARAHGCAPLRGAFGPDEEAAAAGLGSIGRKDVFTAEDAEGAEGGMACDGDGSGSTWPDKGGAPLPVTPGKAVAWGCG